MPVFKRKNENFFKTWSPEMAYVLGFFAADGYMIANKRGAHFIDFYNNNRDILEKIRNAFSSNHAIAKKPPRKNQQNSYRLQIGSKIWFRDLTNLGFTQNKSLTLLFPKIPRKYISHFVRGYFDGDGNVWTGKMNKKRKKPTLALLTFFTSGSKDFLQGLLLALKTFANIQGGWLGYRSGGYRLSFSTHDSLKLHRFMYSDAGSLFLSRKQVRFRKFVDLRA